MSRQSYFRSHMKRSFKQSLLPKKVEKLSPEEEDLFQSKVVDLTREE